MDFYNTSLHSPPTAHANPATTLGAMLSSQIANQFQAQHDESTDGDGGSDAIRPSVYAVRTPSKSSPKTRSLSDSTPKLSPSPKFKESRRTSRDDHTLPTNPRTPRRPDFLARGLSLQMPPGDMSLQNLATSTNHVPPSPQPESRGTYGSPAKVLPRHSRGLDFSRACTNLHHSTLAEQSSPDSSPTITQKAMMIPPRNNGRSSMVLESPNLNAGLPWSNASTHDRTATSSSVGSINMLGSDSSSSDADNCDPMDPEENDDPILSTPQVSRSINPNYAATPFHAPPVTSLGAWQGNFSPGAPSFTHFRRAQLRKGRSRKSSSSASGHSSMASPGPTSPPPGKNESGYFAREYAMRITRSRRESLTMGTNDLHISSGNDSGDEAVMPAPLTPGVVRRPVTRRGNLLPKPRAFGRIRAELMEESTPVDTEVKREAEVIRQVRESDIHVDCLQPSTSHSSPTVNPTVPSQVDPLDDIPEDSSMALDNNTSMGIKGLFGNFSRHASRNGGGPEFWNSFDMRTPPPPFFPRANSSAVFDDVTMDSPSASIVSTSLSSTNTPQTQDPAKDVGRSRSSTPQPQVPPSAADGLRKVNKRRRDDDLDITSIKRRAVSPGMSVQNSPILSQSPGQREGGLWGQQPKVSRESSTNGHAAGERSNSGGSVANGTPSLGPKRIGLQGMTDTNDGLMKMSIE